MRCVGRSLLSGCRTGSAIGVLRLSGSRNPSRFRALPLQVRPFATAQCQANRVI